MTVFLQTELGLTRAYAQTNLDMCNLNCDLLQMFEEVSVQWHVFIGAKEKSSSSSNKFFSIQAILLAPKYKKDMLRSLSCQVNIGYFKEDTSCRFENTLQ